MQGYIHVCSLIQNGVGRDVVGQKLWRKRPVFKNCLESSDVFGQQIKHLFVKKEKKKKSAGQSDCKADHCIGVSIPNLCNFSILAFQASDCYKGRKLFFSYYLMMVKPAGGLR